MGLFLLAGGAWAQDATPPSSPSEPPAATPTGPVAESPAAADSSPASSWTEADTRLANQYIALLQQQPEYGSVLDLLWNLYQKRGQTSLLLQYFEGAAKQGSPMGQLLYGHLLRKSEDAEGARAQYELVLKAVPRQKDALRGVAEILERQGQKARALSSYVRLVEIVPASTDEGVALRLRLAALLRETEQTDQAVRVWEEILAAHPGDVKLRTEVVGLLLEASRSDEATKILESVVRDGTVEQRIDALRELARLHEFVNDFDAAASASRRGMALAHFRNYVHEEFFTRLVRLYERFGRLPELEEELRKPASQENPGEREVSLMAEFYRLTVRQGERIRWTRRLVELVPASVDYRLQLASLLLDTDGDEEAEKILAELLAGQPEPPLPLVLLRAQAAMRHAGKAAAGRLLTEHLDRHAMDDASVRRVLDFAREYYLDDIVERLLQERGAAVASQFGESVPFEVELARFHRERGRTREAVETLERWISQPGLGVRDRTARLHVAARTFRDQGLVDDVRRALEKIIELNPDDQEALFSRAELLAERRDVAEAVAAYDALWHRAKDIPGQIEIDQRLFGLLRGLAAPKKTEETPGAGGPGNVLGIPLLEPLQEPAFRTELRRQSAAIGQNQGAFSEPPSEELVRFYERIKKAARDEPDTPHRFRAAWWAFKLVDLDEARTHLAALHNPEMPVLDAERLFLELAEQTENRLLVGRQLELLSRTDPDRGAEYRHRWAEFRFELGYEDEAVRLLQQLAASPDATLNTLKSLANVYQKQGRTSDQVRVWKEAFDRANLFEKREIVKQFTNTLVENGRPEEALKAYLDLIAKENDLTQKRKQLDAQVTLANRHYLTAWLKERYQELAQQHPFERFFPEALARVHEVLDNHDEAYQAMKRAYYMAGHDRELLDELSEMATRSRDLKAAIYYRRQIISQNEEGATPDNWQALAGMLEEDLRVGEADAVRERLESKFSQNADFLRELVRHYRESGQLSHARRVLERLRKLRPWDNALAFELGLLRRDAGDHSGALECFESVITQAREAALPPSVGTLDPLPIVRGGWAQGSATRPDWGGLETFALTLQETPFMDSDVQDALVEWFRKSRPEHDLQPRTDSLLRLRAIEEAARLSPAVSPEAAQSWVERWTAEEPPISATERLWALAHAGAGEAAAPLIRQALASTKAPEQRLLLCLVAGRLGLWSLLGEWIAGESDAVRDTPSRALYPALSVLLLGVENQEPLPRRDIAALLPRLMISESFASHLLKRFEQAGAHENSLMLGELLAESSLWADDTEILYSVAHAARQAQRPERQAYWLERAAHSLHPRPGRDVSAYHSPVVTEWAARLPQADERRAFLDGLEQRFGQASGVSRYTRLFVRAQGAILKQDRDTFLGVVNDYRGTTLELAVPEIPLDPDDLDSGAAATAWKNFRVILNLFGPRSQNVCSPLELANALTPQGELPFEGLRTRSEAEEFVSTRILWSCEGLPPAQRWRLIQEQSQQLTPDGRMELARTLEAGAFFREAARLYDEALEQRDDTDYPLVNAFLLASRRAKDYQAALSRLTLYEEGRVRLPQGYNSQKLSEDLAEFLALAGQTEELKRRADTVTPGFPSLTENYRRRLVETLARLGQTDALLAEATKLAAEGQATRTDRLRVARALAAADRKAEATAWLEGIAYDLDQRETEMDALRMLTGLLVEPASIDPARLERHARQALRYDNPTLTIEVAARLDQAGLREEATGALWLAARREKNLVNRHNLMAKLLTLRATPSVEPSEWERVAAAILEGAPASHPAHAELLGALAATLDAPAEEREAIVEAWRRVFAANTGRTSALATVTLGQAMLDGAPPARWGSLLGAAPALDASAAATLLADVLAARGPGHATELRAWLDRQGSSLWAMAGGDTGRQVAWFGIAGDRIHAAELHARLIEESLSERFLNRNSSASVPMFENRWRMAQAFADAGFDDFAGSLFRAYAARLSRWVDQTAFLEQHARFLLRTGDFAAARTLLERGFQKEIGLDPALLVEYHRASGKDDLEGGLRRMQVAPGVIVEALLLAR